MDDLTNTGASDQATAAYCARVVYSYASMFRAFCAEQGVSRTEAREMVKTIISARESVAVAMLGQAQARGEKP